MLLTSGIIIVDGLFIGNAGIWLSYPLAELVTLAFAVIFFRQSWRVDLDGLVLVA